MHSSSSTLNDVLYFKVSAFQITTGHLKKNISSSYTSMFFFKSFISRRNCFFALEILFFFSFFYTVRNFSSTSSRFSSSFSSLIPFLLILLLLSLLFSYSSFSSSSSSSSPSLLLLELLEEIAFLSFFALALNPSANFSETLFEGSSLFSSYPIFSFNCCRERS